MANQLSEGQLNRLEAMEMIIRNGFSTFCEVGVAIMTIRDQKLFPGKLDKNGQPYETIEAYCQGEWGMGRAHAYRQIAAAQVIENLKQSPDLPRCLQIGGTDEKQPLLPQNEAQARPLTILPAKDQGKAWIKAVEQANGVPRANVVQKVARQFLKCPRCTRLGTPLKDCQACKRLRKGTPSKPSPIKPPKIVPETGLAGACRQMLEVLYERFELPRGPRFQEILLAAHDLDDAIAELARQLEAGPDQEPEKAPSDNTLFRFDAFWKAYPRKTSKKDAEAAFTKLDPSRELYLKIMTAIDRQKTWDGWKEGYIPEAARWLNGEKWDDEEPKRKKGPAQMSGLREWAEKTIGGNHDQA